MIANHEPLTLYLLHFVSPVSGKRHYCGICRSDRLEERMKEHATGRGAGLTRRAALAGVGFYRVYTQQNASWMAEKKFKASRPMKERCPVCQDAVDPDMNGLPMWTPRLPFYPASATELVTVTTDFPPDRSSMKKGRQRS